MITIFLVINKRLKFVPEKDNMTEVFALRKGMRKGCLVIFHNGFNQDRIF